MNNLEYDHADIFPDLGAIQTQFHHLLRTVPANGLVVCQADDQPLNEVLERGCWTTVEYFGEDGLWQGRAVNADDSEFEVLLDGKPQGTVGWTMIGRFNMHNALAAIAAARHAGVPVSVAIEALCEFRGIKRRLELRGEVNNIRVYDDFAHHPTAIAATVSALRKRIGDSRLVAVLEPRSNTMRMGVHKHQLAGSLQYADKVILVQPDNMDWDLLPVASALDGKAMVMTSVDAAVSHLQAELADGDHVLIMSNGGFGGIHGKLLAALER